MAVLCETGLSHSTAMIVLSGITDTADVIIARKWNMVSDLGKILDPFADKLTQAAIILCLSVKYKLMRGMIALFAVKEFLMALLGYLAIRKKNSVNSAKWYGKVNTVILYLVLVLLILLPDIPDVWTNMMILTCGCFMLLALVLYIRFYCNLLFEKRDQ